MGSLLQTITKTLPASPAVRNLYLNAIFSRKLSPYKLPERLPHVHVQGLPGYIDVGVVDLQDDFVMGGDDDLSLLGEAVLEVMERQIQHVCAPHLERRI